MTGKELNAALRRLGAGHSEPGPSPEQPRDSRVMNSLLRQAAGRQATAAEVRQALRGGQGGQGTPSGTEAPTDAPRSEEWAVGFNAGLAATKKPGAAPPAFAPTSDWHAGYIDGWQHGGGSMEPVRRGSADAGHGNAPTAPSTSDAMNDRLRSFARGGGGGAYTLGGRRTRLGGQ
jgi:hypothetical protein